MKKAIIVLIPDLDFYPLYRRLGKTVIDKDRVLIVINQLSYPRRAWAIKENVMELDEFEKIGGTLGSKYEVDENIVFIPYDSQPGELSSIFAAMCVLDCCPAKAAFEGLWEKLQEKMRNKLTGGD